MPKVATAQQFVVDELVERGATILKPATKSPGIGLMVRTSGRNYIEIRAPWSDVHSFQAYNFKPHSAFYILGIMQQADAAPEAGVLPTPAIERYGERSSIGTS
jgi:hypothetical protein